MPDQQHLPQSMKPLFVRDLALTTSQKALNPTHDAEVEETEAHIDEEDRIEVGRSRKGQESKVLLRTSSAWLSRWTVDHSHFLVQRHARQVFLQLDGMFCIYEARTEHGVGTLPPFLASAAGSFFSNFGGCERSRRAHLKSLYFQSKRKEGKC